jgi:hypothetical protein
MHLLQSSVLIVIANTIAFCIISGGLSTHADDGITTTTVSIINDVRNAVACSVCAIRSTCPPHGYENDILDVDSSTGIVNATPLCLQLEYSKQAVIDDHQLCGKYFVTCSMGVTSFEQITATTFEGTIDSTSSSPSRRHSISASLTTITKQFVINGIDDEGDTSSAATGYEQTVLEILNPKLI